MCESKCDLNAYVNNGNLIESLLDHSLKNLGIDTVFITGSSNRYLELPLEIAIAAKKLGYKTFIIRDTITFGSNKLNELTEIGIGIVDSTALLKERYSCPENWLQCPLSGECISTERQCDGYVDCNDGSSNDEDPKTVLSNCCDEFILSVQADEITTFIYTDIYRYMGVYEKVACSRLIIILLNLIMFLWILITQIHYVS